MEDAIAAGIAGGQRRLASGSGGISMEPDLQDIGGRFQADSEVQKMLHYLR